MRWSFLLFDLSDPYWKWLLILAVSVIIIMTALVTTKIYMASKVAKFSTDLKNYSNSSLRDDTSRRQNAQERFQFQLRSETLKELQKEFGGLVFFTWANIVVILTVSTYPLWKSKQVTPDFVNWTVASILFGFYIFVMMHDLLPHSDESVRAPHHVELSRLVLLLIVFIFEVIYGSGILPTSSRPGTIALIAVELILCTSLIVQFILHLLYRHRIHLLLKALAYDREGGSDAISAEGKIKGFTFCYHTVPKYCGFAAETSKVLFCQPSLLRRNFRAWVLYDLKHVNEDRRADVVNIRNTIQTQFRNMCRGTIASKDFLNQVQEVEGIGLALIISDNSSFSIYQIGQAYILVKFCDQNSTPQIQTQSNMKTLNCGADAVQTICATSSNPIWIPSFHNFVAKRDVDFPSYKFLLPDKVEELLPQEPYNDAAMDPILSCGKTFLETPLRRQQQLYSRGEWPPEDRSFLLITRPNQSV